MKCIVIVVGLLAILALTRAEDNAAEDQQPESELDSEPAPPAEQEQPDENEHPRHHHHDDHHPSGQGNPEGKPPKRIPVGFKFGFNIDTGK